MARVYLETYGCTLNQADSDILKALVSSKHQLVDSEGESEVIILNTCTVKGTTENKILSRMKSADKKLVIAGCLSANEEKIRTAAPLAPIVGTSSLKYITNAVDDALEGRATVYKEFDSKDSLPKLLSAPIMRIPINDGCLSACNFCQTKIARPYLRSYSPKTVVNWINESVKNGAREIQLTSMDSGAYGRDIKTNLVELLEAMANDDSSKRANSDYLVRLGMINPDHAKAMLPDLIRTLEGKKFYKFLHIPVQAGSEKVVKEMNRDHTVQDFVDIVEGVRKKIPEATISTDIIVGYPTETKDDFLETLQLLRKTKPDIINISRFSPRPGTKAKKLKQLTTQELKRRSRETHDLVMDLNRESRRVLVGKRYDVLVTEANPDFKGRNINYQQVVVKGFKGKLGDKINVKIIDSTHGTLFAELD